MGQKFWDTQWAHGCEHGPIQSFTSLHTIDFTFLNDAMINNHGLGNMIAVKTIHKKNF